MNKKLLWTIVGLVVVVGTFIGLKKTGVIGKDEGLNVSAEKAALRTIIETVNASGKVYPEIEVKVSPDVSGEIIELNVNEGDSVRKGQVLARIYADIYSTQRDQFAAGVEQAKAQLSNSTANIPGLKAILDNAKAAFERQRKLYTEKVTSRQEYDQAEQAYRTAEANYKAATEGLKGTEAAIMGAEAQLARANKDLSRTTLVAPMDGVISLLAVKKGERVVGTAQMAGTEMMRVADMRSIEIRVDVGENDIPKVKLGDTALVEVDAYTNRKFKGLVYKIANPNTQSTGTAVTSTEVTNYKVHIRLIPDSYKDMMIPGRAFPFRPGMSASADIQTNTKQNVLAVPLNAVTTREKNSDEKNDKSKTSSSTDDKTGIDDEAVEEVVFVVQKDNKVKKVKVKTAIQDLNYIEVLEGLNDGDQVVTGPFNTVSKILKDGNLVKVVPKDKLFEEKKKE
ncbi:efflux RND transporter periplasmic adaptor subunit [Sediminibacterium sp. KACHI17]|jgi:HlyD family secretion protein|uniref:Efflux RND transporter periplasmic adaptor subunit n=1 Tax=Sediminibacterium sp. KACHI17 TaxID=1751071 RepID=A0AAT9GLN6_9BACT